MAFTITIPGIIRLVAVSAPDEVLAVNDASMVVRSLSGRGGLVNRSVAAKLAVFRTPDGDIWPAFRDRLDPLRAAHQEALEAALSDVGLLLRRIAPEIAELGSYVRTGAAHSSTGVIVQQAVGRLFFTDYAASEESYDAARTLQSWLSAGPLRRYWLKRSGALQVSLDRIMDLSRGDLACAHATALAMDNIVRSIELMRRLARHGDNLAKIGPQDALAHTLRAPATPTRRSAPSCSPTGSATRSVTGVAGGGKRPPAKPGSGLRILCQHLESLSRAQRCSRFARRRLAGSEGRHGRLRLNNAAIFRL